jgi:thiamine kinase-like enzyme
MPKTLVHGDFNASNVLVTRSASGHRIRIIDWESAGVGPGLLDLASLVSGRLPERHREAMVAAYRGNLAGSRLGALSAGELHEALDWCRLALAVQWLGWSPGWSPPEAHAYDWRAEARTLAQNLGLLGDV